MGSRQRAVAIVVQNNCVLVMRRHREGRRYTVLPGGGVETGETPEAAVVRELAEETNLAGRVLAELATIHHPDCTAHYFVLSAMPSELRLGGPEVENQSETNRYTPHWLSLNQLEDEPLVPDEVRGLTAQAVATPPL